MKLRTWIKGLKESGAYRHSDIDQAWRDARESSPDWKKIKPQDRQQRIQERLDNPGREFDINTAEKQAYDELMQREQAEKVRLQNRGRVKNVDKAHRRAIEYDARRDEVLGRRQERLDYRARRDDVMSRRQERLDYRARRDDVMSRRQQRLDERAARKERNIFIDDVQGRLAGSSASRETIEEAYKELSSQSNWDGMSRNDKISAVMDNSINRVARNVVTGRMTKEEIAELSGNATLHKVIDERVAEESGVIRKRMEEARKNRNSGAPKSAQEQALDNPVNSPATSTADSTTEGFDFDSINLDGATKGGLHAFNKKSNDVRFAEANLNRALTNEDVANAIKNRLNVTDDELAEMVDDAGKRNDIFRDRLESAKSNPTMMDNMWGNKVPQIAGGALLTAGLVSSLSNSKGQQSNAALYGQQQPFY